MKSSYIAAVGLLAFLYAEGQAGVLREDYIDRGPKGPDFPKALLTWEKGKKWSEDDRILSNSFDNDGNAILKLYPSVKSKVYIITVEKEGMVVTSGKG